MTTMRVPSDTTAIEAESTASVLRVISPGASQSHGTAVSVGGGLYLSAGHVFFRESDPDTAREGLRYDLRTGLGLDAARTAQIDGPDFSGTVVNGGWGVPGGSDIAWALSDDAVAVRQPMIVFADPNNAAGDLVTYGFAAEGGFDGQTMVRTTGALGPNRHITVNTGTVGSGNQQVLVSDPGMDVLGGQSGSGMWLITDLDGNGVGETYLAGILSLRVTLASGAEAAGFEPLGDVYTQLGAFADTHGLSADAIAPVTLVSGQDPGSAKTTLTGTGLHEIFVGSVNADTFFGAAGADTLSGGHGDDVLDGGSGNDRLLGGDGSDRLADGAGKDNLTGGAGADVFAMVADGQADAIKDFDLTEDRIDLSAWGVSSLDQLTITQHASGKVIVRYGPEAMSVNDGAWTLAAGALTAEHFVFADAGGDLDRSTDIQGTAANDKLIGTGLAERLFDGAGIDNLFGRGGADVFAMAADGRVDSIKDFERGLDRIDLTAWGVTGFAELDIQDHSSGKAILRYGAEILSINDGSWTLPASSFSADDFVFA